jgi:hypothetical protein
MISQITTGPENSSACCNAPEWNEWTRNGLSVMTSSDVLRSCVQRSNPMAKVFWLISNFNILTLHQQLRDFIFESQVMVQLQWGSGHSTQWTLHRANDQSPCETKATEIVAI